MIVAEKSWRLNRTIITQAFRKGNAARAFLESEGGGLCVRVGLPALLSSRAGRYVSRCAGQHEQEEQPQQPQPQPQQPQPQPQQQPQQQPQPQPQPQQEQWRRQLPCCPAPARESTPLGHSGEHTYAEDTERAVYGRIAARFRGLERKLLRRLDVHREGACRDRDLGVSGDGGCRRVR